MNKYKRSDHIWIFVILLSSKTCFWKLCISLLVYPYICQLNTACSIAARSWLPIINLFWVWTRLSRHRQLRMISVWKHIDTLLIVEIEPQTFCSNGQCPFHLVPWSLAPFCVDMVSLNEKGGPDTKGCKISHQLPHRSPIFCEEYSCTLSPDLTNVVVSTSWLQYAASTQREIAPGR